jgi:hypothetical protein
MATAILQHTGGWVLYVGEERVGWWYDWNSLAEYCESRGVKVREVRPPVLGKPR